MEAMADRVAQKVVSESVEAVARHKTAILSYGCAVAGTGGAVIALAIVLVRLVLAGLQWMIRSRKTAPTRSGKNRSRR